MPRSSFVGFALFLLYFLSRYGIIAGITYDLEVQMLQVTNVSLQYGSKKLFEDVKHKVYKRELLRHYRGKRGRQIYLFESAFRRDRAQQRRSFNG